MTRRRRTHSSSQGDLFSRPLPQVIEAFAPEKVRGASLSSSLSKAVAAAMKECGKPRDQIARDMSRYLGEAVSPDILDKYASEAAESHIINVVRFTRIVDAATAAVTVTAADAGTLFYQFGTQTTTFTLRPCTELAPAIGGAARGCAFFGFSNNNGTGDVIVRMTPGGGSICGLSVAGPQTSLTLKAGESITMLCDGANMWVTWSQPSIEARIRQSRDGTGYQVLPGGLVEMWGSTVVTTESYGNSALALPLTCPGGVKNVLAFNGDYNAHPDAIISEFTVGYPTAGAIAIHASNASGAALANTTLRIRWRALGAMS